MFPYRNRGPGKREIKAFWACHKLLDEQIEAIELEGMEGGLSPEEIRERTRACVMGAGITLPCDVETFLDYYVP